MVSITADEVLNTTVLVRAGIDLERVKERGHIAIFLHGYLKQHGMSVADFNEHVLEVPRNNTTAYGWINLRGKPSRQFIRKMHDVLHVPLRFFDMRALDAKDEVAIPTAHAPASWTRTHATVRAKPKPPARSKAPSKVAKTARETAPRMNLPMLRPTGPVTALVPLAGPGAVDAAAPPSGLRYVSHGDGTVTVSLCARMDVEHARPLFRMLLDAGLDGVQPGGTETS